MRYAAAAAIIVAVFSLGGFGGYVLHGQGKIRTLGSGNVSCGRWLADKGPKSILSNSQKDWINGYLTGAQDEGEPLSESQSRDLEGRAAWIDTYCQSNPPSSLLVAARALYRELLSL